MKRRVLYLSTVLLLLGVASCQKEDAVSTKLVASMEQCADRQNPKVYLDGTLMKWGGGEMVMIRHAGTSGGNDWYAAYTNPHADNPTWADLDDAGFASRYTEECTPPYEAYFPVEAGGSGAVGSRQVKLPAKQTEKTSGYQGVPIVPIPNEFPMYAYSNTNTLQFKNLCGLLKVCLPAHNVKIDRLTVTADVPINGIFSIGGTDDEPTLTYQTNGSYTTVCQCDYYANSVEKVVYIALPAGTYSNLTFTILQADGAYCVKHGSNIVVERSKYSVVNIQSMTFVAPTVPAINGGLSGLFSVSGTQQVRFSQGNLQYQASTNTWRFAEKQSDYVGCSQYGTVYIGNVKCSNHLTSSTYNGWIDLFGWGTSGWNNGNRYYRPYDCISDYAIPNVANDGYGPTDGTGSFSLTGDYANADWGVYNPIVNGGNQPGLWRTLAYDEWKYLLEERPGASSKCLGAMVNGIGGLVLLPDNWAWPAGLYAVCVIDGLTPAAGLDTRYAIFNQTQWEVMETAGAVFLPMAGSRGAGQPVALNPVDGMDGGYWSSTCLDPNHNGWCPSVGAVSLFAEIMEWKFTPSIFMNYGYYGGIAQSVRLVQDVE